MSHKHNDYALLNRNGALALEAIPFDGDYDSAVNEAIKRFGDQLFTVLTAIDVARLAGMEMVLYSKLRLNGLADPFTVDIWKYHTKDRPYGWVTLDKNSLLGSQNGGNIIEHLESIPKQDRLSLRTIEVRQLLLNKK